MYYWLYPSNTIYVLVVLWRFIIVNNLSFEEFHVLSATEGNSSITYQLKPTTKRFDCPTCSSEHVVKYSKAVRTVRDIPICGKDIFLSIHMNRLLCRTCGHIFYPRFNLVAPHARFSSRFKDLLLLQCKDRSILSVANEYHVSEGAIRKMIKKSSLPDKNLL